MYLINDLIDRNENRRHRTKQNRPVTSDALSTGSAGAPQKYYSVTAPLLACVALLAAAIFLIIYRPLVG
jgi:4-hydroxybenzoate polyprenyltransferase